MEKKGIDARRIVPVGKGEKEPLKIMDKSQLKKVYDDIEVDPLKPNPWEV